MYPNIYLLERAARELPEERLREARMDHLAAMAKADARAARRARSQKPRSRRKLSLISPVASRLMQILRG